MFLYMFARLAANICVRMRVVIFGVCTCLVVPAFCACAPSLLIISCFFIWYWSVSSSSQWASLVSSGRRIVFPSIPASPSPRPRSPLLPLLLPWPVPERQWFVHMPPAGKMHMRGWRVWGAALAGGCGKCGLDSTNFCGQDLPLGSSWVVISSRRQHRGGS